MSAAVTATNFDLAIAAAVVVVLVVGGYALGGRRGVRALKQRLLALGYPSRSTYHNWCKQAREHGAFTLDVDVLTRISAVLGIHQGLGILFPTEQLGVAWLRTPHSAVVFGGRPPLDLVTSGAQDGLLTVRRFLDGARGGLYMQPNAIDEAFAPCDDTEIVFR